MDKIRINLYDILLCLSNATNLVTPNLSNHHQQVAYLSFRLAQEMNLSREEQRGILIGGLLHDIGALSMNEKLALIEEEPITINSHAFRSAKLLQEVALFAPFGDSIRYHHVPWNHGKGAMFKSRSVPMASHILHLADRVCVLIKQGDILAQIPDVLTRIRQREDIQFVPQIVEALQALGKKEYIWLELIDKSPLDYMPNLTVFGRMDLDLDDVISISKMFSRVIDFRSRFTATHSAGVAITAEKLGEIAGFSENECKMLLIAGNLHDLGKLAIDDSVLEKPSQLSPAEFNVIRSHTFYTYKLLDTITGFETINKWASYHHEKLDGTGYPFHLESKSIPMGSRIMAVADVFTAITEHRPYRKGMNQEQIVGVLQSMAEKGALCPGITDMLLKNLTDLREICQKTQHQAELEYERFYREEEI